MHRKRKAVKAMHSKKDLSLRKFIERFSAEEACEEFLFQQKWSHGFVCPKCGCQEYYHIKGRKLYQCKHCHHQSSVTSNTVMHRTHKPLTTWFLAIYFVASDKRGISACTLAGKLDVSYETAWYMLARIRKAMDSRESRYMLAGIVELDDSYFGAKIKGKRGRAAGQQSVIVGVSKDSKNRPQYLKMTVVPNVQRQIIKQFTESTIEKGTVVQTDGYRSYVQPLRNEYNHEAKDFDPNDEHLKWLHTIIGNAKAFLNGTYHGTSVQHLQAYLSEFCYRFNRRSFRGQIFDRLVIAVAQYN